MIAIRERHDECVEIGRLRRAAHVFVRERRVTVADVLDDARVEEVRVLADDGNVLAEVVNVDETGVEAAGGGGAVSGPIEML